MSWKAQSTIYIEPKSEDIDLDEAVSRLQKVFGIVALTRACVAEKNWEDISEKAKVYLEDTLPYLKTFKVEAKRSDKKLSDEITGNLPRNGRRASLQVPPPQSQRE